MTFTDSTREQCGGWQRLVQPTPCDCPPKWILRRGMTTEFVCGLHLAWAVRQLADGGQDVVVTRLVNGHVR